jgi:hypothetical protein
MMHIEVRSRLAEPDHFFFIAATLAAMRLLRRAAVFLWIVPVAAILSSVRAALRISFSAAAASPLATAFRKSPVSF